MGSWGNYLKIRNEEINASEAGLELFSGVILARFLKCYDVISGTIELLINIYHTLFCFIV